MKKRFFSNFLVLVFIMLVSTSCQNENLTPVKEEISKERLAKAVQTDKDYSLVLKSVAESNQQSKVKLSDSELRKIEFPEIQELLAKREQALIHTFGQNDAIELQKIVGWDKIEQANAKNPYSFDSFFNKLGMNYVLDKSDLYDIINQDLGNGKRWSNGRIENILCDTLLSAAIKAANNGDWGRAATYYVMWNMTCNDRIV